MLYVHLYVSYRFAGLGAQATIEQALATPTLLSSSKDRAPIGNKRAYLQVPGTTYPRIYIHPY